MPSYIIFLQNPFLFLALSWLRWTNSEISTKSSKRANWNYPAAHVWRSWCAREQVWTAWLNLLDLAIYCKNKIKMPFFTPRFLRCLHSGITSNAFPREIRDSLSCRLCIWKLRDCNQCWRTVFRDCNSGSRDRDRSWRWSLHPPTFSITQIFRFLQHGNWRELVQGAHS